MVGDWQTAQLAGLTAARVFLRGFLQVSLVAANTRAIAQLHYEHAFVLSTLISLVWWSNSSGQREQFRGAGTIYAFGAAVGTVVGMWAVSRG